MLHKFEIETEKDIILAVKNWIHLNFFNINSLEVLCSWTYDLTIGDRSLVLKSVYYTTYIPLLDMEQEKIICFGKKVEELIKHQIIKFAKKNDWIV